MTLSFWQRAARTPALPCDVAVVGGGLLGCAVAYWLRRLRPRLRVVIVEAKMLGSGASGRNAGFLLQGGAADYLADRDAYGAERARRLWHFTQENRDLIVAELEGKAFGLEASGSLRVAGTEEESARLRTAVSLLRAGGVEVAYLSPDEAGRRLGAEGFYGALHVFAGAMLDPLALVRHVAAASGAEVLAHHPVVQVEAAGPHVRLETPVRVIEAGQVVLAPGAALGRLCPALEGYARPVRAQMLSTEPTARWLHLPVYTHDGYFYIRQAPDGCVLLGGARHLHRMEEIGSADATTPALQADLEGYLHRHFPSARRLAVRHRWSGTMSFSPDHLPVVGVMPGLGLGSFWVAGCSGHGLGYGFRLGRLVAELVLDRPHPEGLDLFTQERFAPPQTAKTKHQASLHESR